MKKKKIFCLFISIFLFMIMFSNVVYGKFDFASQVEESNSWKGSKAVVRPTQNVMQGIIEVVRIVGTFISLIMLTYLGIKYMSQAPEDKAEFKKSSMGFIVGAFVLFGASQLVVYIEDFATSNL